jgi:hypothetical protein
LSRLFRSLSEEASNLSNQVLCLCVLSLSLFLSLFLSNPKA